MTQPMITSSIRAGVELVALGQRLEGLGGQVHRVRVAELPVALPAGVRTASTITAVVMVFQPGRGVAATPV